MRLPRPRARTRPVMSERAMEASAADVVHLDALGAVARIGLAAGAQLGVTVVAVLPDQPDRAGDLLVGVVAAQQGAQVVAVVGEQAEEELALGRQARAVAVAAEGV